MILNEYELVFSFLILFPGSFIYFWRGSWKKNQFSSSIKLEWLPVTNLLIIADGDMSLGTIERDFFFLRLLFKRWFVPDQMGSGAVWKSPEATDGIEWQEMRDDPGIQRKDRTDVLILPPSTSPLSVACWRISLMVEIIRPFIFIDLLQRGRETHTAFRGFRWIAPLYSQKQYRLTANSQSDPTAEIFKLVRNQSAMAYVPMWNAIRR